MKNVKLRFLSIFSILLLLFISACSQSDGASTTSNEEGKSNSKTEYGDSIVVGITNAVGPINPLNVRDVSAIAISSILFEPLFTVDDSMEVLPRLAESIETTDNQSFTIKLRPDMNWTDGKPVTSQDVKFTFDTLANPNVQSTGLKALNIIEGLTENGILPEGETSVKGIEVVDEKTFVIHTKTPVDPNYLKIYLCSIRTVPSHILKDKDPSTLHQDPFMLKPNVTNGAYTLKEYNPESHVELKANPDFYRGVPKTEKIFFKVVSSSNLTAQLQTGEIHLNFPGAGSIAVQDFERIKAMEHLETVEGKPFDYQMLYFNTNTISDPKVRQAIVHAINRPQIVEKLYQGKAEIVDGPYTSMHPYLDKSLEIYEYNPEKAKQLLEEAGWDKSQPIRFNVPVGNQVREQASVIISENLRAVGLNAQIQKYDFPTHMQKGAKQEFDLMYLGLLYIPDPDVSVYFQTKAPFNFAGYNNPKVDQLFQQGREEPNPEKRKAIYNELQQILHEDLPTITLYADYRLGAVSKKVNGVGLKQYGMFANMHEWVIEK